LNKVQDDLRREAARLLESGDAAMVIAWEEGSDAARTAPAFAVSPAEAAGLVWNPFCVPNLVKYLLDYRYEDTKIAVAVKGCDERAVNRLVQDRQFPRERIVVLGLPCGGMLDRGKTLAALGPRARLNGVEDRGEAFVLVSDQGEVTLPKEEYLLEKCLTCVRNAPARADVTLGPGVSNPARPGCDPFAPVRELEALSPAEKSAYWDGQFSRCLRCYACRNVCPACNCKECSFEQAVPGWQQGAGWISKNTSLAENYTFHLIRMFDVAGRCIDCGECERVCPVGIPLSKLYRKVLKDAAELFAVPTPGLTAEEIPVLGSYSPEDKEEFM